MTGRRSALIGIALALGYAVVLAPPALLVWNILRPEPLSFRNVRVRYQGGRFDAGALVLVYEVENRSGRSVRLLPGAATFRATPLPDAQVAARPTVKLPLDIAEDSPSLVEIRLELRARGPLARNRAGVPPGPGQQEYVPNPLEGIGGFELNDPGQDVRIVFPRPW